MSSATSSTGRYGDLYAGTAQAGTAGAAKVARTTQWTVSQKPASTSEWGDSSSGGYTNRAPGRRDCTFTAEGKFDTTSNQWEIFQGGDYCAAILYSNVDLDMTDAWFFPRAVCMDFGLTVNIDTEEVIGWTSSWGSDGTFTPPGGTIADCPYAANNQY